MMKVKNNTYPMDGLKTRAALLLMGKTLKSWAEEHGFERSTVYRAVHFGHCGRKSLNIRRQLSAELGI